jgi:FHS family L-fucose permease-like MFS transporter
MVSLYWGGAMVGRFIGSYLLARVQPAKAVAACAAAAGRSSPPPHSCPAVGWRAGRSSPSGWPTRSCSRRYSPWPSRLGRGHAEGAGIVCMAIVGGAILPPIAGLVADHFGLQSALIVPVLGYIWIATYGWISRTRQA